MRTLANSSQSMIDLTSATNLLITVQNAYGLSQKDMAHVSGVLIQTQNTGKVTVDELAASMGKVIPTPKEQGVSVEQLGESYAIMTSKGIKAAKSSTYINSMFNSNDLDKVGAEILCWGVPTTILSVNNYNGGYLGVI